LAWRGSKGAWKGVACLLGAVALQTGGCAGKTPPARSTTTVAPSPYDVPGKAGKLMVLPVEDLLFPDTASVLNTAMTSVKFRNVSEFSVAKVSMEVAQLSLECVEPSDLCYQSVGRFLGADDILWAKVKRDVGTDGNAGRTVTIRLFDVAAGRLRGSAEERYATPPTAQDMDVLLRKALARSRGITGVQ
jgi:hypothetical protein